MDYAELHCKTNFSFLEGASHPQELVERAAELGYAALAVTDRNTLAGVVRAHAAAKSCSFPLVIGAEIVPVDGPPLVLWVTHRAAYGQLARLITVGRRRAVKGACQLTWEDVAEHAHGLLAGLVTSSPSTVLSREVLGRFRELFGGSGYLLAAVHRSADDRGWLAQLAEWSRISRVPLLAAGDVLYHHPSRLPLYDVLTAIRHGTTVAAAGAMRWPNAQRHLRERKEIEWLFASVPDALHRTQEVAAQCTFSLDALRYEYPEELTPRGMAPWDYLRQLTWKGAYRRYPGGIPDKVRRLLDHELTLIKELRYEAYFLTVWDLVRFARRRDILCQGRGSAANSAVCYCLGVTSVDPDRMDVLFERFVSRERNEAPDIDVDFEHERREEVLQYLYEKYGRERAGMTGVVITYRSRSAIRDVGKALGFSLDRVDSLAKQVDGYAEEPQLAQRCRQVGIDPESESGRRLIYLVEQLLGFPRHLSQHVGGMVITQGPLCELVPIENAAMADRTVIEWDKDDLDTLGLLKVDCLALGMLTAIHRCFDRIRHHTGRSLTLASVPAEDPRVYDMMCRADTVGVFQIESRAQMSMLPRLQPRCFYDLVIEVAIVRPGPIQGNMVHPYLRRRAGEESVSYPNDAIRAVLHKTLGVPIFQEQAMRLAVVAAGFTPGEADELRRAMGAWRRPGVIDRLRSKLLAGMHAQGLTEQFAEDVFHQIRGFGEYGFPESHAASFALLVYVSAWLKCFYPAYFTAALINSQPMGFYAPAQLVQDARRHGVRVLPIDVNFSDWDCTLEVDSDPASPPSVPSVVPRDNLPHGLPDGSQANLSSETTDDARVALRLGFRLLRGLPRVVAVAIEQARREGGPFRSLTDLTRRCHLGRDLVARLSAGDVFGSLARDRRAALWEALAQDRTCKGLPLLDALPAEDDPPVNLPRLQPHEEVLEDYRAAGMSLKNHPLSFYRTLLEQHHGVTARGLEQLPHGAHVRVAGLVLLRQRPSTAKGITFVTLEDETGTANLLLHASTWQRYYQIARRSPAWFAHGRLERQDSVIHVIVERLEDLSQVIGQVAQTAGDLARPAPARRR